MAIVKQDKLNQLMTALLPEGVVAPAAWLGHQGYSPQLLGKYVQRGWLHRVGRGAYLRPGSKLTWQGVVMGLQRFAQLDVHVGGLSVFELAGHSHFVRAGQPNVIDLYSQEPLPKWVATADLPVQFRLVGKRLFEEPAGKGFLIASDVPSLRAPIWVSCLERAYLELLDDLPDRVDFDRAEYIMQGLPALSPSRLQTLLKSCKSVKVKRLFFFFADRHDHGWRSRVRSQDFSLGSGKRQIVKGGRLDPKYHITVPAGYLES